MKVFAASFVAAYEVADLVAPRTHPGRAHPAGNDVVHLVHGLRTVRPVDEPGSSLKLARRSHRSITVAASFMTHLSVLIPYHHLRYHPPRRSGHRLGRRGHGQRVAAVAIVQGF